MDVSANRRLHFGDYELDLQSERLLRDGHAVRIQPQPLRVLAILVEHAGAIVSREEIRKRIWGDSTFVEFDQGLNFSIRQIRIALRENALAPRYIETLPKQGYRFIAPVTAAASGIASPDVETVADPETSSDLPQRSQIWRRYTWQIAAAFCAALAVAGIALYLSRHAFRARPTALKYTQLTQFTDSALAPALSPDGRMIAFIRGSSSFLTADQIYVKALPDGEARRLTDDRRQKYNVVFTPDGSQIAYTVLDPPNFSTYTVSVLGGDSHLFLNNAAGLTWLDERQLLFSQIWSGQHMGLVTATATRENFRELYLPAAQRGMVHYNWASPDRKSALVVEMDEKGAWAPCRIVSLQAPPQTRPVGPKGSCVSAGWSPDGSWMYFAATVRGESHLWRQRFPNGEPEQITFGPTEEQGLAVERDGRSIITSMGGHESSIWIHDPGGERSLSAESEGEIVSNVSPPTFSSDDKVLYYLLRRGQAGSDPELWRMTVATGKSEAILPGVSMLAYDISPDGKQVVYSAATQEGKLQLWLASVDRKSPARRIGSTGELWPHFGPRGQILFLKTENNFNYLEQMNPDGSGRSKVVPYPINGVQGVSPGRHWVMAAFAPPNGALGPMAVPVEGGSPRRMCASFCVPKWSSDGKYIFIPVEEPARTNPGRSLAIPVGPDETLPPFPPGGIEPEAEPDVIPGSQSVGRGDLVPGRDPFHFAYVKTTVHRNLYRITLP